MNNTIALDLLRPERTIERAKRQSANNSKAPEPGPMHAESYWRSSSAACSAKVEFPNTLANQWVLPWVIRPKLEISTKWSPSGRAVGCTCHPHSVAGSIPRIHLICGTENLQRHFVGPYRGQKRQESPKKRMDGPVVYAMS